MTSNLLVQGVTLPAIDGRLAAAWAGVAHQMAREIGARVAGPAVAPGPGRNYYALPLVLSEGTALRVMLNVAARLVACGEDRDAVGLRRLATPFHDVPRPDLFILAGFVVADRGAMERSATQNDLVALGPGERRDVNYHGVSRLGDVLFNWFD